MRLNEYGNIIRDEWLKTGKIRHNVVLDEFVIMPNHVHGIIIITDHRRDTSRRAPTTEQFGKPVPNSMPTIARLFKPATTKRINQPRNTPGSGVWQRNYYEHVIRGEDNLNRIRQYILDNPARWVDDDNTTNRLGHLVNVKTGKTRPRSLHAFIEQDKILLQTEIEHRPQLNYTLSRRYF